MQKEPLVYPMQPNAKEKKDDILNIVKQFINFFEETDRSEEHDNRINHS